jgi:predicted dienelactone hydrolase
VVAANHPGSTTGNSVPALSAELWLQTSDISALISAVTTDPRWKPMLNPQAIGVIGHSKGGYSTIAAIGGKVRLSDFIDGCRQAPQSPNCQFYTQANVALTKLSARAFDADYTDPRIRFAVALDPGMVPYLLPTSLRRLSAPLLIVEPQHFLPDGQEPGLGGATLAADNGKQPILALRLSSGNHFDFLPVCQPKGRQILASEEDDGAVLCASSSEQREAVHRQTLAAIMAFIHPWLPAPAGNR